MAAPDPLPPDEQFTAADWKEAVANFRPSGPNSFSQEGGEAGLTGLIRAIKVRGCLRFMLGYNNVTLAAPKLIQRTNPIFHPRYTNMVCTNASEDEFSPGHKHQGDVLPLKTPSNPPTNAGTDIKFRTGYEWARVTARFQPIQWELASDDGIDRLAGEDQRNVWTDLVPRTEFLSLDGYQLLFAEGQANTPPLTNPKGKAFPAPFGQILVKPDVEFHWKHVPERFVMLNSLPANIMRCLGKLNHDAFRGFAKGTLLLLGAKMTRTMWPLAAGTESLYNYQISLAASVFDPPKGKSADAVVVTERGHNNMPWRGTADAGALTAGDFNAGKWFLATRTGGDAAIALGGDGSDITADPRLIPYANFQTMFQQAV